MAKKKKEINITEYREAVIYTSKFITYTDDGTVLIAEQERDESKLQLEVDLELIPNFLSGHKHYSDYKIDYFFKIKQGIITDSDDYEDVEKYNNVFYEIPKNNNAADVVIEHDKLNRAWVISLNNLSNIPALGIFSFFICKKDNPNLLYASYEIEHYKLNEPVEIKFKTLFENEFNELSIFTIRKFKSYTVRNLNV